MRCSLQDDELMTFLDRRRSLTRPSVRSIQSLAELSDVYRLTHDCYVENEYVEPHPSGILIHYAYFDHNPFTTILVARLKGQIAGSVSVTLDSEAGLTVDDDFKDICDEARAQGRRLAAVWRLVVERQYRAQREVVTALIREVIHIVQKNRVENCYFSVNPRHVSIYQRMLNMTVVSESSCAQGLSNAPAVLLCGDPSNVPERLTPPEAIAMPIPFLLSLGSL